MQNDRIFKDGAVVTEVDDSRITLRLSRDTLPEGALLQRESSLLVRVGGNGSGYKCRCVVLYEEPGEDLQVAVVGRVTSEDSREYFRLETAIPVILFNVTAGTAEETGVGGLRSAGPRGLPRIVNISGGGVRVETEMAMAIDDTIYATFHLPLPEPKTLPVVAKVIHTQIVDRPDAAFISSGLNFTHINERDRDAIVRYVCNEEIKKIRLCRKEFYSLPDKAKD